MMTPEEFERFKEAEKEHLRAIKQLQATARRLRVKRSVQEALNNMLEGVGRTLDVHDEMMYRLAIETARHEARYELATEELVETNEDAERAEDEDAIRAFEEEQVAKRARELVRHMKRAQQEQHRPGSATSSDTGKPESSAPEEGKGSSPTRPDKTIGRM